MKKAKLLFVIVLSFFTATMSFGQGEANIWYFGEQLGLDFSTSPPTQISGLTGVPSNDNIMEACASISNASGQFLFAVSAQNIYHADKTLAGTSSGVTYSTAQGTMITPVPGSPNQYFLTVLPFGTTSCTSAQPVYRLITVNGTTGKNLTLGPEISLPNSNVSQGQMILPKADNLGNLTGDYWLVLHERNSNRFFVYTINSSGITFAKTVTAGPTMACNPSSTSADFISYFKANFCYNQFAYSYNSDVHLFDFDIKTGDITFRDTEPVVDAYGLEFSKNGKYLYVSTGTDSFKPKNVYSIPVNPGGSGSTLGTEVQIGTLEGSQNGGNLQMGPDGVIYGASMNSWGAGWNGKDYLAAILNPESGGSSFDQKYITFNTTTQNLAMGLPSFITSLVSSIASIKIGTNDLAVSQVCKGTPVTMDVNIKGGMSTTPGKDKAEWIINSGTPFYGNSITQTFNTIGKIPVQVTVWDQCDNPKIIKDTINVVDYITANATQSCSTGKPVLTGTGNTTVGGSYKWYDKSPTSGGVLLGVGNTFTPSSTTTSVYVEPSGVTTTTNINDSRTGTTNGNNLSTTTLVLAKGSATINSFNVNYYSYFPAINGAFTATLRNSLNQIVGTVTSSAVVNVPSGTVGNPFVTISPTDWVIGAGTYTITITSPTGATVGDLSTANYSSGDLSLSGGRANSFKITAINENSSLSCVIGSTVNIGPCCTAPVITAQPVSLTRCEGANNATFTVAASGTVPVNSVVKWQKSTSPKVWVDIPSSTSMSYTVPTSDVVPSSPLIRYRAVLVSTTNCFTYTDSVSLTVNPTPATPTLTSNLTPNTSFSYCSGSNMTLTSATTTALTPSTPAASWSWTKPSGSTVPTSSTNSISKTGVGLTEAGVYEVSVTINGCTSLKGSATVSVKSLPVATVSGSQSLCSGVKMSATSVSLNPTTATFDWSSSVTSGTITGGNTPTSATGQAHLTDIAQTLTVANGTSNGVLTYTITPKDGACVGTAVTHVVTVKPSPVAPVPTSTGPYCEGANIVLKSNVNNTLADSWSWTGPGGFTNTSEDPAAFASTSANGGTYDVTVTKNGCTSAKGSVTVVVNSIPVKPVVVSPVSYCKDTTTVPVLSATALSGHSLVWYGTSATGGTGSATPSVIDVSSTGLKYYYVSQKNTLSNCESSRESIQVTINARPVFSAAGDKPCKKTESTITLNASGGQSPYTYKWVAQANAQVTGTVNSVGYVSATSIKQTLDLPSATTNQNQVYDITVRDANGCTSTSTATVEVNPCPYTPDFTATPQNVCLDATGNAVVTIDPSNSSGNINNWTWDLGGESSTTLPSKTGVGIASLKTPSTFTVTYNSAGTKTIKLEVDGTGTTQKVSKVITIQVGEIPVVTATDGLICSGALTSVALSSSNVPSATFSWVNPVSSPSGIVTGGSASTGNPTSIAQTLINSSASPADLTYQVVATGPAPTSCVSLPKAVKVTVNPLPVVTLPSDFSICSGDAFPSAIGVTSTTSGASFSWTSVSTNASGSAGSGSGASINETLTSTSTSAGTVVYTVKATGPASTNCASATPDKTITVTINPKPTLTTAATAGMCSNDGTLNIGLVSDVSGASFSWTGVSTTTSPTVTGVTAGPSTSSSITDNLNIGTSTVPGTATYTVVTSKAGCSTSKAIAVTVSARPVLTALTKTADICSGTSPNISVSTSFPTIISWTSPVVTQSITGGNAYTSASAEASATINDVLTNPNAPGNPGTVTYTVVAGSVGCQSGTETITVTVDKCPVTADFTVDKVSVCDGTATVIYTDNSSSSADDWTWTFPNGTPSSATGKGPHSVNYDGKVGVQSATLLVQDKSKLPLVVTNTKTQSLVTVNAIPNITNTALEQLVTICSGSKTNIDLKSDQANTVFSWVAPTVSGSITGASAGSATAPGPKIDQKLDITGTSSGTVTYKVVPDLAGCKGSSADFVVTVEPIPTIAALSAANVCSGAALNETITADVSGSTIAWTRSSVTGITPLTGSGSTGSVTETLTNGGSTIVSVQYVLTPTGPAPKQCVGNPTSLTVNVAPTPKIANIDLTGSVCSGEAFIYTATSTVTGSTLGWTRAVGTNVTNAASSGSSGSINETLNNPSTSVGTVQYVITPTGPAPTLCAGTPSNVDVKVNPLPVITSVNTGTVCSESTFTYNITTGLATQPNFTWKRAAVGTNLSSTGTSSTISEKLVSSTLQTATYKINAVTAENCTNATDFDLDVLINPLPTGKLSITPQICAGDSPVLTATVTGTGPFNYTVSGTGMTTEVVTASNSTTTTRTVSPTADAIYSLTALTDATGCVSTSMQGTSVTVNPLPESAIGSDQTICQGTTAQIEFNIAKGTGPYSLTYQYYLVSTPNTKITVPTSGLTTLNDNLTVSPSASTAYTVTAITDSKGCKALIDPNALAIINVTPRPNVVANPGNVTLCSGQNTNIVLTSSVPGTVGTSFKWIVSNPPSKVTGITTLGNGDINDQIENNSGRDVTVQYTVTPTYLGCTGSDLLIPVKVRAKTEPILLDQTDICPNTKLKLKTNKFTDGGTYSWDIDGVPGGSNKDTLDLVVDGNKVVTVTYTDICGEDHLATATLEVKQEVTITFAYGDTCMNSVTSFMPSNISDISNKTVIDAWKWNFNNYIVTGDSAYSTKLRPETTFQYDAPFTYDVKLEAYSEGCSVGKVTLPVKIKDCTVRVKNTITPNGDDANEVWIVENIESYPNAGIEIFNRWGVLIWSCNGNCGAKQFAGRNEQGQELEQGTYYYVITLNKGKSIKRGYINVIRDPGN